MVIPESAAAWSSVRHHGTRRQLQSARPAGPHHPPWPCQSRRLRSEPVDLYEIASRTYIVDIRPSRGRRGECRAPAGECSAPGRWRTAPSYSAELTPGREAPGRDRLRGPETGDRARPRRSKKHLEPDGSSPPSAGARRHPGRAGRRRCPYDDAIGSPGSFQRGGEPSARGSLGRSGPGRGAAGGTSNRAARIAHRPRVVRPSGLLTAPRAERVRAPPRATTRRLDQAALAPLVLDAWSRRSARARSSASPATIQVHPGRSTPRSSTTTRASTRCRATATSYHRAMGARRFTAANGANPHRPAAATCDRRA